MLLNYLKVAFRGLVNNKTYSFINIVGLALGMAMSVLILLFVMHEFSYDKFHVNRKRIFQVIGKAKIGGDNLQISGFPTQFAPSAKAGSAHVTDYVRLMKSHKKVIIKNPEKPTESYYEEKLLFADPSFLKVFSFKLKQGNSNTALSRPNSIVISERLAEKYFGSNDPVGKVLSYNNEHLLQITGVAENPPSNSSLDFDFLIPVDAFPTLNGIDKAKWAAGGNFQTYLLLDSENMAANVEKTLNAGEKSKESIAGMTKHSLENIATLHLGNNFNDSGNTRLIYIFAGIAILILSLALFNYMSLTTARATMRAKEVGVRKVVGSGQNGLVKQFYAESAVVCFLAFVIAFLFIEILRYPFYELLDLRIDNAFLMSPLFIGFLVLFFFIATVIAGSYPALILSGFAPVEVLKGKFSASQKGASIRQYFMVFQFAVSIALVVCSLVVKSQVTFMQNIKLGFHKDQVLVIPVTENTSRSLFALRDEIAGQVGVQGASIAGNGLFRGYNISFLKNPATKQDIGLINIVTDPYFVKTLGIEWKIPPVQGAFGNQKHVILNEVAVKEFGVEKKPLGNSIADLEEVVGVVKNFYFNSPQDGIKPMGLIIASDTTDFSKTFGSGGVIYARLDPKTDINAKVESIKKIFKEFCPGVPFESYFLDEAFNKTFKTQIRMSKMFSVFTGVAIFIACMGLFGLVTFTAQTRTKEIGIRKVLGASVSGIVAMISKDFVKLILVSIVIALPAAWYFMDRWLQDFTYRITIPIWIYLAASILAIAVALLTISFQSIKAALVNPVESLKSE